MTNIASLWKRYWLWLKTIVHTKLIAPLHINRGSGRYMARSVMVGLVIALTPLLGLQMLIVGLIWIVVKRWWMQWNFNLVIAMAWTWTTNLITVVPLFYVYIITGRLLLGYSIEDTRDYQSLNSQILSITEPTMNLFELLVYRILNLFNHLGVPLFVGSIPWMVMGGWLSYWLTLRSVLAFKRHRRLKARGKNRL